MVRVWGLDFVRHLGFWKFFFLNAGSRLWGWGLRTFIFEGLSFTVNPEGSGSDLGFVVFRQASLNGGIQPENSEHGKDKPRPLNPKP